MILGPHLFFRFLCERYFLAPFFLGRHIFWQVKQRLLSPREGDIFWRWLTNDEGLGIPIE